MGYMQIKAAKKSVLAGDQDDVRWANQKTKVDYDSVSREVDPPTNVDESYTHPPLLFRMLYEDQARQQKILNPELPVADDIE
jgi:hypothetical protein